MRTNAITISFESSHIFKIHKEDVLKWLNHQNFEIQLDKSELHPSLIGFSKIHIHNVSLTELIAQTHEKNSIILRLSADFLTKDKKKILSTKPMLKLVFNSAIIEVLKLYDFEIACLETPKFLSKQYAVVGKGIQYIIDRQKENIRLRVNEKLEKEWPIALEKARKDFQTKIRQEIPQMTNVQINLKYIRLILDHVEFEFNTSANLNLF